MSLYVLGFAVVFLLGIVVAVTLGKTRWGRTMTEPPVSGRSLRRRVSGGEDD